MEGVKYITKISTNGGSDGEMAGKGKVTEDRYREGMKDLGYLSEVKN